MDHEKTCYTFVESEKGPILVAGSSRGLRYVNFQDGTAPRQPGRDWVEDPLPLEEARVQLRAYFSGRRTRFDLPRDPEGTPFQLAVWKELCQIPYGQTVSYGALARAVGRPGAARAVGAACGRNPLAIVVPCHRVVGADGRLTGFTGGLDLKTFLLKLEGWEL